MKKHICVVSTPLVLLNAQEYVHVHCSNMNNILYILIPAHKKSMTRLVHLMNIIDLSLWSEVKFWYVEARYKWLIKAKIFYRAVATGLRHWRSDKLSFNNTERKYLRLVYNVMRPKQFILLDDGLLSLSLAKRRTQNRPLGKWPYRDIKQATFFTIFNIDVPDCDKRISNHSSLIKDKINVSHLDTSQNYFLGQPLVDLGYIGITDYIRVMEQRFAAEDWIYVPHPEETIDSIKEIENLPNVRVVRLSEPVETWITNNPSLSSKIKCFASITTTALMTLPALYGNRFKYKMFNIDELLKFDDPNLGCAGEMMRNYLRTNHPEVEII